MVRILIAEDEYLELNMLKKILSEKFGYIADIRTADNGFDALSIAEIWGSDIILFDIEMPGLNGINAAKEIIKKNHTAKIIFITAYERFDYAQEAVKLHAADFLLKPVEDSELVLIVGNTIKQVLLEKGTIDEENEQEPFEEDPVESLSKTGYYTEKIAEYIKKNYMHEISQDTLSNALNLSSGYLSRIFHQNFGERFSDYLNTVRINAAKDLLADPTKSIKDIADAVGFQSSSYFTKVFKLKTNLTTTEYRNKKVLTKMSNKDNC